MTMATDVSLLIFSFMVHLWNEIRDDHHDDEKDGDSDRDHYHSLDPHGKPWNPQTDQLSYDGACTNASISRIEPGRNGHIEIVGPQSVILKLQSKIRITLPLDHPRRPITHMQLNKREVHAYFSLVSVMINGEFIERDEVISVTSLERQRAPHPCLIKEKEV